MKYEFEVIPFFAGELPAGVDKCLFCWERGSHVFVTDPEPVNQSTHAVFWKQFLKQQTTMYKSGNKFASKEHSFKVQTVGATEADRKTIGKVRVDLAQFCTDEVEPQAHNVVLQLKPQGKLKVSIKATWLRDAKIDMEQMTEVSNDISNSELTGKRSVGEEQDLSGFEASNSQLMQRDEQAGVSPSPDSTSHKAKNVANAMYAGVKGLVKPDKGKKETKEEASSPSVRAPSPPPSVPAGPAPFEVEAQKRREAELAKKQAEEEQERYQQLVSEITQRVRDEVEQEYQHTTYVCCCIPVKSKTPGKNKLKLFQGATSAEVQPKRQASGSLYAPTGI